MKPGLLVLPVILSLCPMTLFAEKNASLETALVSRGVVIREDRFDSGPLAKPWVVGKGDWQIQEGALVGREKTEDMHAAVLTLTQPSRNSVLRYSFKLDGATGFNLSFNHAKGHLFRIAVNETGLSILKDKDKKDTDTKPATLAKAAGKFPKDQWHTMLVEIQGDKVTVQTDHGVKLEAHDAALDVEKTGYRFVTKNGPLYLDDVTVWGVAP